MISASVLLYNQASARAGWFAIFPLREYITSYGQEHSLGLKTWIEWKSVYGHFWRCYSYHYCKKKLLYLNWTTFHLNLVITFLFFNIQHLHQIQFYAKCKCILFIWQANALMWQVKFGQITQIILFFGKILSMSATISLFYESASIWSNTCLRSIQVTFVHLNLSLAHKYLLTHGLEPNVGKLALTS